MAKRKSEDQDQMSLFDFTDEVITPSVQPKTKQPTTKKSAPRKMESTDQLWQTIIINKSVRYLITAPEERNEYSIWYQEKDNAPVLLATDATPPLVIQKAGIKF